MANSIHDALFKATFSQVEQAASELKEGRQEGVLEGRRVMLLKQLGARFRTLPDAVVARVNSAGTADLEVWAERVLTAATLAEVVGDV
ncbi:hypothetical protein [Chondromyces apiculatus]|uniref:DUF4351 domain-containing protein n=1 Tax=Chondromyces apiculatus DSM 436 TaxID=1192034 RepID=A0A017TDR7_9BACT|nr:hypothetical protein [Chondromyces apiculatus]EYF06955.1 Hypothetical protein CAP_1214 [Chondromyces apiculatus DSM 436]